MILVVKSFFKSECDEMMKKGREDKEREGDREGKSERCN